MSCFDLSQRPKNNASFRFFAVGKGHVSKRVPGREKTGIYLLKPLRRNSPFPLHFCKGEMGIHYSDLNLDSGLFRVTQYCSPPQAMSREKQRNDNGLGLFIQKSDAVSLLRRRRHFFRVKFLTKGSTLSVCNRDKKQEVESE